MQKFNSSPESYDILYMTNQSTVVGHSASRLSESHTCTKKREDNISLGSFHLTGIPNIVPLYPSMSLSFNETCFYWCHSLKIKATQHHIPIQVCVVD